MLPATLQFLIVRIASAINDRLQRKLDYVEEERRILWSVGSISGSGAWRGEELREAEGPAGMATWPTMVNHASLVPYAG